MSFFKNIFGASEPVNKTSVLDWQPLTALSQLDSIVATSENKPVLIFKHSTRCSISRFALKQFENEFNLPEKIELYFLDVINYRAISTEIAERFSIQHQSPQIVLIKNGVVVYDASHDSIDAIEVIKWL